MEKGLTSYVLNDLLTTCFDSKADMARQLDMSKRALQRVMNEPQLSKGGSVLSQIILDNTSAAEQIPKDARGRFITADGTVFQGYLFNEERL